MRYLLLLLLVFCQVEAMNLVRVTPVAYHDKEWYFLLSRSECSPWNGFMGRPLAYEKTWISASRIMREESGGFYHLNVAIYPYCSKANPCSWNDELVFFIPVAYQPVEEILCAACKRTQYQWVAAKDVAQVEGVSSRFVAMVEAMWPGFERGYQEYEDHDLVHKYPSYPLIANAPPSTCTNLSWYRLPCIISFYRKGASAFELAPVYPASFQLDGARWPSVEHYMEAMKFPNHPGIQLQIRNSERVVAVTDEQVRLDWDSVKAELMLRANFAKFEQNPCLKYRLMQTRDFLLVFDTRTNPQIDEYWGAGRNGAGRNVLGQILMQLRYEFGHHQSVYSSFIEQPLACFTNSKYFAPPELLILK